MTRSINLKEYQQRLITRMMASRERRSEHTRIGFQVGTRRCLLKLEEAEQILPVPSICPAPLTQTWFCGLAEVRGEVFGVIDLAEFIEKKKTSNNQDTRLIIIGQHLGKPSALMVTKVFGIRHIQKYKMKDKTEDESQWFTNSLIDEDDNEWLELSINTLINDEWFSKAQR